ncbi:hypothetical protein DMC25_19375 [Caulobacter sp. D4A]|jgi:hypothetical protein|uniref:hypothetical protein n=1 Tax=unclassified Caulobacter TaxID=2648921 RepID=UPI000D7264C2|nr:MULTISPECIES: hypothetical protein [unclassified Caulobacter]PXA82741.1 hypothetical protein DMC25_19375 [Caulobacter sp. D4A]PXA96527.1 hypothetical protein DMC18_01165 [Caulobacter sp. D5]
MSAVLAIMDPAIEEAAEFGRCIRSLCPTQQRVLTVLLRRLVDMEAADDADGAVRVVDEIRRILCDGEKTRH